MLAYIGRGGDVLPFFCPTCESWILNNSLLKRLESFQAELGKRILRLPKCTSNRVIRMVLRWPSVRARVLYAFKKIGTNDDGLSSRVFRTLAVSDVESNHLVQQYRYLEATFHSNFTSDLNRAPSTMSINNRKAIFSKDYSSLLADAAESSTLRHVLTVAVSQEGSWPKFWDHALDKGAVGT